MALFIVLVVFQPYWALAQPQSPSVSSSSSQPVLLSIPKGTRLTTPQGTFQGFSLSEFKVILKIESDYRSWGAQLSMYQRLTSDLKKLADNQLKQTELLQNQVSLLREDRDRISKKWTEENRLRHLVENRPNFGSWIAWSIAAATAATAAVLAGILIAKN